MKGEETDREIDIVFRFLIMKSSV